MPLPARNGHIGYLAPGLRRAGVDVVEIAERLLAGPEPGPCLDLAEDLLAPAGFQVTRHEALGALVAWRGSGGVLFSGHVDVVPVGEGWTVPAFGNELEAGCLHGRGASDMRGPVACMLAAARATDGPMGLVLTSDEETTMEAARHLVEVPEVLGPAGLVVVGEPTELQVASCGKGVAWIALSVTAPSGHASTPRGPEGRPASAPERLVELLARLPPEPLDVRHPVLGSTTAALTGLESQPGPFNVLASRATGRIDCRFPAPVTPEEVLAAVERALGHPDDVEVRLPKREPAFEGDEELAQLVAGVVGESGTPSATIGVPYASEAGHWGPRAPTVICGPGSIDRAHAPDEFIEAGELEAGLRAYTAMVESVAGQG